MKNLPEKDFWNEVKTRLNNYSETPDDDGWDRIAGALPKAQSTFDVRKWSGIALIFFLGTSTGYLLHQYAPLSSGANASLTSVVSGDEESSADKISASEAEPLAEGNSDQTLPAKNSGDAADKEGSKHSSEAAFATDQNTAHATSSLKTTHDRQADNDAPITKEKVSAAADHSETETIHKASIPGNEKRGMAKTDLIHADQHDTESSAAKTERSGKMSGNTGDRNSVTHEPSITSGDDDSSISSREALMVEGEKREGNGKVMNSTQHATEQSSTTVAKSDETTSSNGPKSNAAVGTEQKSVQGDSMIVEKPEQVVKIASGQNEKKEQKQKKEKRIFHADVYANLTPSLSFQKITPSGNDELRIIGLQSNGVMSGDRLGISLEAGFQRKLTPRLDFYVGLSYYRQKQTLTYDYNGTGVTVEQGGKNGQYSITPMKESKSFEYNMTNAGISSGVMYHLVGDKLMHKIGGGFQFQKGLMRMGSEGYYNNAESFYFNYQLSYRMECKLNSKWNIYLQPTFIHSLIAHEELSEPFTIKPYRAGLGIGAIYHF